VKNDGSRGLPYSAPVPAGLVVIHSFIHFADKDKDIDIDIDSLQAFYNYNNYDDLTTTTLAHTKSWEKTATTA
jgi:hypothetical protein